MPRKAHNVGNGAKRTKSTGHNAHRFLEYDLTSGDKEILRREYSESDFPYDLIEDLVGQGYKFSLSYSDSGRSYIATLTDRRADSQFQNTSLSGRGASPANARIALLYRHYVVAQEDWHVLDQSGAGEAEDFA